MPKTFKNLAELEKALKPMIQKALVKNVGNAVTKEM
jgi:hypothetical protein